MGKITEKNRQQSLHVGQKSSEVDKDEGKVDER